MHCTCRFTFVIENLGHVEYSLQKGCLLLRFFLANIANTYLTFGENHRKLNDQASNHDKFQTQNLLSYRMKQEPLSHKWNIILMAIFLTSIYLYHDLPLHTYIKDNKHSSKKKKKLHANVLGQFTSLTSV